jgi:type II secretory pathway pseudopilin PulG
MRNRKAYSFVEILVASVVFAIALLPVFSLLTSSSSTAKVTKERVLANNYAIELANQVCTMRFDDIPVVGGFPLNNDADSALLQEGKLHTRLSLTDIPDNFTRELVIENLGGKAKIVKAVISWGNKPAHQLTVSRVLEWAP